MYSPKYGIDLIDTCVPDLTGTVIMSPESGQWMETFRGKKMSRFMPMDASQKNLLFPSVFCVLWAKDKCCLVLSCTQLQWRHL